MMKAKSINLLIVIAIGAELAFHLYQLLSSIYFLFNNSNLFYLLRIVIFQILPIVGLAIFISSKYKKFNLLQMYMAMQVILLPFSLVNIYDIFNYFSQHGLNFENGIYFIPNAILSFASSIVSCIGMWHFSKMKVANIQNIENNEAFFSQFNPAKNGLRFTNRFIDLFAIVYVGFFGIASVSSVFHFTGIPEEGPALFLLQIPFLFYYYLILEGIFGTTIGKIATNTIVTNEYAEKANFGLILGRTFCCFFV